MKYLISLVAPIMIWIGAASCGTKSEAAVNQVPEQVVVQTFSLSKGQLTTHMTLPGELRPFQSVDLYAKVNSFVKKVLVDVGSIVKKDQLLVVLEAPEMLDATNTAAAIIQTNKALYQASKANYLRIYQTSKIPGTISPNDLDIAYAKMSADSTNLEAARSTYHQSTSLTGYLEVRAPFAGVISASNLYPGAYAGPAGAGSVIPLLNLQEQVRLRLVIAVPEAATSYFKQKDTVHFTVKTLPGKEFTAHISRVAGSLDLQLRTEQLQMDVVNTDKILLPGMFAQVSLDLTNQDKVFLVAESAVTENSRQIFVIRITNGKTEWIPVRRGRESDGNVEIFGNLQEGDRLVSTATDELRSGMLVQTVSKKS
ncbi:MAG TPA: efflux RND transporter periplasmic adaptor subunit [Puia sp.]|nr:efflux RND transporter periplasmic adaptor subunit [Puia sp.]